MAGDIPHSTGTQCHSGVFKDLRTTVKFINENCLPADDGPVELSMVEERLREGARSADGVIRLEQLKNASIALASLGRTFARIVESESLYLTKSSQNSVANSTVCVAKAYILEIPNELLSNIFELVYHSSYSFANGTPRGKIGGAVALVCRRFRDTAFATPVLWGDLSLHQNEWILNQRLSRVKNTPLHIYIIFDDTTFHNNHHRVTAKKIASDPFFKHIRSRSQQWKTFEMKYQTCRSEPLSPSADRACVSTIMRGMTKGFGQLSLPLLEKVSIELHGWSSPTDEEFFTSWQAPSLRSVKLTDYIPRSSFGDAVKECHIMLETRGIWGNGEVAAFLEKHPSVANVSVGYFLTHNLRPVAGDDLAWIPSLRKLSLQSFYEPACVMDFMNCIDAENVEELSLGVNLTGENSDDLEEFERMMEQTAEWESLTTLDLNIYRPPRTSCIDIIFDALKDCPLKHLSLSDSLGTGSPFETSFIRQPPPLQSLSLKDCESYNSAAICDIVGSLKNGGHWESFEKLKVEGLSSGKMESVAEVLLPTKQLVWKVRGAS